MKDKLDGQLAKFWKWAGMTVEEYEAKAASDIVTQDEWEGNYPYWKDLERAFDEELLVYNDTPNEESANLILQALAIDNESEIMLNKIETELTSGPQSQLIMIGSEFILSNARWQIADLLKEVDVPNKIDVLIKMIVSDKNKYVKRRAILSLAKVAPGQAEYQAYENITDGDEYIRLVSLRILKGMRSTKLHKALSVLENDPSVLVQSELKDNL